MLHVLQFIATLCTAVFAGAAIYINIAEHPARMTCSVACALAQWARSYRRAARMQAPLALVGFLTAVAAWSLGAGTGWLVAGALLGVVIPFTLIGIQPTNNTLLAIDANHIPAETPALLKRWARLHAARSALSLIALVLLLWSLTAAEPPRTAAQIIERLHMEKIPAEGAWFTATYRSEDSLAAQALPERYGSVARAAGSAIYALVTREDFSAMHRLRTDEIWHYYGGNPLELLLLYPDGHGETAELGPNMLYGQRPQIVVKAGVWQGAKPLGRDANAYTFFGNTLAPGFDYADFTSGYRDELQKAYPAYVGKIAELTREEFARRPEAGSGRAK